MIASDSDLFLTSWAGVQRKRLIFKIDAISNMKFVFAIHVVSKEPKKLLGENKDNKSDS